MNNFSKSSGTGDSPFTPDQLGFGMGDGDDSLAFTFADLGFDAETRRSLAFERSRVSPDDPRYNEILFKDRYYRNSRRRYLPNGRPTTTLAPRAPYVRPPVEMPPTQHGTPREVLKWIDRFLDDDRGTLRARLDAGPTANDDALFDALRRAIRLRRDAPDAPPDPDTVPADTGELLVNVRRNEDGDLILTDDGDAIRRTYSTHPSTRREWGNLIRPTVRTLIGRGYTVDQIVTRLNATD